MKATALAWLLATSAAGVAADRRRPRQAELPDKVAASSVETGV